MFPGAALQQVPLKVPRIQIATLIVHRTQLGRLCAGLAAITYQLQGVADVR